MALLPDVGKLSSCQAVVVEQQAAISYPLEKKFFDLLSCNVV